MKKIFAIALAVVMVLSMASAFAAANLPGSCSWGAWSCTTYTANCGVAKAEVVKFVKTNDCDPYVQSDCAAVVTGLPVFYGVKVVFEENVNEQWFKHANTKLVVTISNIDAITGLMTGVVSADLDAFGVSYDDVKKGGTFWLAKDTTGYKLVKDADFDGADCVFGGNAAKTSAKVCANVEYEWNGQGWLDGNYVQFGKYEARYDADKKQIIVNDKATGDSAAFGIADGVVKTVETGTKVYNAYYNGKFYGIDTSKINTANGITQDMYAALAGDGDTCSFLPAMMQALGLEFGTCVNADGIKAFFGWDDDDAFKSCVTWDKNAQGVVNAECVVAIPKTGDASVLAWLF